MTDSTTANRRHSYRRRPRAGVEVRCRLAGGAELAVSMLDASQTGLQLLAAGAAELGKQVAIAIEGPGVQRLERTGTVRRMLLQGDGRWALGIHLHDRLPYADLIRLTEL